MKARQFSKKRARQVSKAVESRPETLLRTRPTSRPDGIASGSDRRPSSARLEADPLRRQKLQVHGPSARRRVRRASKTWAKRWPRSCAVAGDSVPATRSRAGVAEVKAGARYSNLADRRLPPAACTSTGLTR